MAERIGNKRSSTFTRAAFLACAAMLFFSCGSEFDKGDPKELAANGWSRFRQDEFDLADRAFVSAIHALDITTDNKNIRADALYGRGIVWSLRRPGQDPAKAKKYFQAAIDVDPKGPVAPWARQAMARDLNFPENSGDEPSTAALNSAYDSTQKENANSPAAVEAFMFQQSLLVKTLKPEDATAAKGNIEAFLKANPQNKSFLSGIYMLRARACETLGDYPGMLSSRINAVENKELDPKNPNMDNALDYFQIGLCAEYDVGDFETARKYFRKFQSDYKVDQRMFIVERELQRMDVIEKNRGDISAAGELGIRGPKENPGGTP